MPGYERSMTIHAPAQTIFDFVADIRNLPKYIPTTKHAEAQGQDRVAVEGGGDGFQYHADGYLHADPQAMHLEWGADERYYSGHLNINGDGGNSSEVTVRVEFAERPDDERGGPSDADINEGLQKALESIENHITGQGGKEEPSAAR